MKNSSVYGYCTSQTFKKDLAELCEKCPLKKQISDGIEVQIVSQANEKKEILPKEHFEKYIFNEMNNASQRMSEIMILELKNKDYKNDPYRRNRIKNYIWNKERIKALKNLSKKNKNENPYPRIFKSNYGFNLFKSWYEKYKDDKNYLANFSFIYRVMTKEGLMYDIKGIEYVDWLNNNFEITISKPKQLNQMETKKRYTHFSTIKELTSKKE